MRKNSEAKGRVYPMPLFIAAAYDKDKSPCCMNAAWRGIYDTNQIMLCLADDHKTTYVKPVEKVGNAFSDGRRLI